ncbi:MAG: hypothetical protein ACOYB4_00755 [Methyloceanibacter sp.]
MATACISGLALLALMAAPAIAEDMEAAPPDPATLECHGEPVEGSGPGFDASRDKSEQAARDNWLEKAKAVFPDANWDIAQDAGVSCAVQGLYSKCFALGIPCRPKGE